MLPPMPQAQSGAGSKGSGSNASPGSDQGKSPSIAVKPPSIELPKGGGAIRGIGEKFAANPVTGTGGMSIPIATSPGRSGFGPQLALSYDSGSGNGPFGFGWSLGLPNITRKTDKGLPQYLDDAESDVYILSGAEDLVPMLDEATQMHMRREQGEHIVHRYRPRVEGLFARIERWRHKLTRRVHWRSVSRDNITTLYGLDASACIEDPESGSSGAPPRIFTWLIQQSYDDKGNALVYEYLPENGASVDLAQANERNRRRTSQRYLKRIQYGNRVSRLVQPDLQTMDWLFEVLFDYGEEHLQAIEPDPNIELDEQHSYTRLVTTPQTQWPARPDPFSSHRAGFELRTYRRCHRVLMLHHIPPIEGGPEGYEGLVRSTEFNYADAATPLSVDEDMQHQGSTRYASFLQSVEQCGYAPAAERGADVYLKQTLPQVDFTYSKAIISTEVKALPDETSAQNLPIGLDGSAYQWVDLDGEGLSGILTQQAGAWYYKPNLGDGSFGAMLPVPTQPATAQAGGGHQLLDLAGDGQLDVVNFAGPTPGFQARGDGLITQDDWLPWRTFRQLPNINWSDPNLRFVDLNGDGHADILVTENDAFTWHPSMAEEGFEPSRRVIKTSDEEGGPHVVFADLEEAIYLADMDGDGLTDIVRIRNGEVCYWPNQGYGHFGRKVSLDGAPRFDHSDLFDHRRIRLADIDGSGTTDIIYLAADAIGVYFNRSGNSLSERRPLPALPHLTNLDTVQTVDLLGNGTACLVWSSPLPADAAMPLSYIDLMGGKPHLLVRSVNNMGAETQVQYAASTKFYLQDKRAGKPWISRLPFPVHVVEQVTTLDLISRNRYTTRYAYHHGYFDGIEREFRGFAMVEQWDADSFAALPPPGVASNLDRATHVPPVHTKTWFHTGVYLGAERVSDFMAGLLDGRPGEYFLDEDDQNTTDPSKRRTLFLPDTVLPPGLSAEEEREAARALKGAMLRQEVYADDASPKAHLPYVVTEQNFAVRRVQARGSNHHAVFFTHPLEALTHNYERNTKDPRTTHVMTLEVDAWGNVLQATVMAYGRRTADPDLHAQDQAKQAQSHYTYSLQRVTNALDDWVNQLDTHRSPLPCEARSFELTGLPAPASGQRRYALHEVQAAAATAANNEIANEAKPTPGQVQRRLVEHQRTYYLTDDLAACLPLGQLQSLALPCQAYQLALTPSLIQQVYGSLPADAITDDILTQECRYTHTPEAGDVDWWVPSGRIHYSPTPDDAPAAELEYASRHFFLPQRYRNPFHTETLSTEVFVSYDAHDLLLQETRDPLNNRVTVGERQRIDPQHELGATPSQPSALARHGNDYRTLQATLVMDPNGNRAQVVVDALGMVMGTAVMGKPPLHTPEGDSLEGFSPHLTRAQLRAFFAQPKQPLSSPTASDPTARALLVDASTRLIANLHAWVNPLDPANPQPPSVASIARETHVHNTGPFVPGPTRLQIAISYSDGLGREIQKKAQASPGPVPQRDAEGQVVLGPTGQLLMTASEVSPRWVGSGWVILNNKGQPVRQYEPFFTGTHQFEFDAKQGVSPVLFYDPAGRAVATLHPNRTWEKQLIGPWRQESWDVNDTLLVADPSADADVGEFFARLAATEYLPTWHALRTNPAHAAQLLAEYPNDHNGDNDNRANETRAAKQTELHAATPAVTFADALGRAFLTVAHNKVKYSTRPTAEPPQEEFHRTRIVFDIEGTQREVFDAKERLVMRYQYDLLGSRIHQASMEAGERWSLLDAGGNPLLAWDSRGHRFHTHYDELRRPTSRQLSDADTDNITVERFTYGDAEAASSTASNLRGKPLQVFDQAGVVTMPCYDFKGNALRSQRQLAQNYKTKLNWANDEPRDPEVYTSSDSFDALNRSIQQVAPHSNAAGTKLNVTCHGFDDAGLLNRIDVWLEQSSAPTALLDPATANLHAVTGAEYDAKGQRLHLDRGNGVRTTYSYHWQNFRLLRLHTRRQAVPPGNQPGPLLQNLHYSYDPAGNITHIRDDAQQTIFFANVVVEPAWEYTYDAVYRLVEATGREHLGQAGGAPFPHSYNDAGRTHLPHPGDRNAMGLYREIYVYDAVGNFLSMKHLGTTPGHPGWTREYLYEEANLLEPVEASNRLTSSMVGGVTEHYSTAGDGYDAHGSMLRMPHLSVMKWDFRDQLCTSRRQKINGTDTDGGVHHGEQTWYVYDLDGQRIRKVTESASADILKQRFYFGGCEVYRQYGSKALTRETLHVFDGEHRVTMVESRTEGEEDESISRQLIRHQFGNHLDSVCLELNHSDDFVSYEEYTPYGSTAYLALSDATGGRKQYRYTEMERDEESGLSYHSARYVAPWTGRWISCDPQSLLDSICLYTFCKCNPNCFSDKTGFDSDAFGEFDSYEDFRNQNILLNEEEATRQWSLRSYTKDNWTQAAFARAFIVESNWVPEDGMQPNDPIVISVYSYYESLYFRDQRFLWAGMAKVAGGAVYGAMANELDSWVRKEKNAKTPIDLTVSIAAKAIQIQLLIMQKEIFLDLAWQHEAFSAGGLLPIEAAFRRGEIDKTQFEAWTKIASGTKKNVELGNKMLLEREQKQIVVRGYEEIKNLVGGSMIDLSMSMLVMSPIPGGTKFSEFIEKGSISNTKDRWNWIKADMLPKFIGLELKERNRLIRLSLLDLAKRNF
jgi:RHS repeat-associated protein